MSTATLRILVVHNRYRSGQPSGEDRVVDQECELLRAAGHQVERFERRSDDISSMSLLERALVPVRVPWNSSVRDELSQRLRELRPDVVHVHNTFPLLSPSVVQACADVGVPVVATLHNYLQVCPRGTLYRDGQVCTDCTHRLPLPAVRHGCYRNSRGDRTDGGDHARPPLFVVVASDPLLLYLGRSAADPHPGWDARGPVVDQTEFCSRPGSPAGAPRRIPPVSRPDSRRERCAAAAGRLGPHRPSGGLGMPLVLAGAGPLSDTVERWARDRDDASYLGLRDHDHSARLVAGAAAVVAPSVWLETFGLVVVEAMAAGVPAVAAAHGAFTELIDDGVCGVLHQPGNAASLEASLRRVVLDTEDNLALGRAARRRYEERFTPQTGLAALIDGYEAAIGDRHESMTGTRRRLRPDYVDRLDVN